MIKSCMVEHKVVQVELPISQSHL